MPVWGCCERQAEIRRQAFCLFLLSPLLSLYVCLSLSPRGVCLYLSFLPSVCLPSAALYISNCPFVFLSQLVQSSHSCALKWWGVMSLFPFKLSPRDNVRWEGYRMKWMHEKSLYFRFSFMKETWVVFAVVSHPQTCNSEQNNGGQ